MNENDEVREEPLLKTYLREAPAMGLQSLQMRLRVVARRETRTKGD